MDHASKVLSMQEDEPTEVQEVVDVVTTANLITKVVTAASETVSAASTIISAAEPQVPATTITVVPARVDAAPSRRRKGVVIRDPEEESTTSSIISTETKSKDKAKGIMVEEPKPLKKKQQIEMDEEYARKLHAELNKDIDWDVAIDHGRMIDELDRDEGVALMGEKEEEKNVEEVKDIVGDEHVKGRQAEIYQINMDHAAKILSMQKKEPEVQEVVEVVTTTKLITEVVTAASTEVSAASTIIPAAEPNIPAEDEPTEVHEVVDVVTTAKLITEVVTAAGTIISIVEPQVPAATITVAPAKVAATPSRKRKGDYGRRAQASQKEATYEMDEEYARKLHVELNEDIDWNVAVDHGMSYDDIRLIFKAKFDSNIKFLLKIKEQMEEQENRALQSINETPAQKAAKRRKLNEEVEDLKRHLEIVPDEDDDVYTEATPLARKVLVMDYKIIELNNKPYYKIIRADGTHQLYISFLTFLKNFDREELEALWSLVKEMFSTSKPKNFSDDFLLTTLGAMFEKPDGQAQV
nr:hypothetical protein [Tanacetum cinerariifolium]